MMKNKLLISVAAILALISGVWISSLQLSDDTIPNKVPLVDIQGHVLDPARIIGIPELIKDDGSPFGMEDLKHHWSIMFFGYTNCPDVCPTTMSVLASAKKQAEKFPVVYFVTIDPQRDKVEMLGEYVDYFDSEFVGVTGSEKMIEALTLQTSVVYMKVPKGENENDYLMDHSASLLLINPEGRLRAFMKSPHTPQSILDSVKKVTALQSY